MSSMKIQKSIPLHTQSTAADMDAKLRDVSKMYEKQFLREMVKSMRSTVDHSEMSEPSMAENMYMNQVDEHHVENWGNQGGIGLADIIYSQLREKYFPNSPSVPRPEGPIPTEKGTRIKIDETKQFGIPVANPGNSNNDTTFLYEWDGLPASEQKTVRSPYDGEVLQNFRTVENRQVLKIAHDNGMMSTLSFIGRGQDFSPGDQIQSGQSVGELAANARGLTWQVGEWRRS